MKHLSAVWRDSIRDSDLDPMSKLVGFTLSTFMNGKGSAWPAKATIALGCAVDKRTVDRALARLKSSGFLDFDAKNPGGRQRTNTYYACLPETVAVRHRSEWERVALASGKGGTESPKGGRVPPESVRRRLNTPGAVTPNGTAPAPEDECARCGKRRPLVDPNALYCIDCVAVLAEEEP